ERTSSYHNGADPKTEQRYESRPMSEADFTACIKALNFSNIQAVRDDKFARLGTEKIDLTGANFEGAEIKACDFRHALLRATKCSGANFTKSTFRYADMQGADLSGCDCEGAQFQGADLRGADFRDTSLTATEFADMHFPPNLQGAKFKSK